MSVPRAKFLPANRPYILPRQSSRQRRESEPVGSSTGQKWAWWVIAALLAIAIAMGLTFNSQQGNGDREWRIKQHP